MSDYIFNRYWQKYCSPAFDEEELKEIYLWVKRHYDDYNLELTEERIKEICHRLELNEPIQYILGECWFYNRRFEVNRHTLIPRPETEELCHLILKEQTHNSLKFLDACTGSGCIAVTLAAERPEWNGEALDISESALETAKKNAFVNDVKTRLHFYEHDLLGSTELSADYNLIVSNPPYVNKNERNSMDSRVLDWEPEQALFPNHEDVTIFYKRLRSLLQQQTQPCVLWAEINPMYANEMKQMFPGSEIRFDMYGKARFLRAEKQKGAV
jgi:release factor glutamine methyltransferase